MCDHASTLIVCGTFFLFSAAAIAIDNDTAAAAAAAATPADSFILVLLLSMLLTVVDIVADGFNHKILSKLSLVVRGFNKI